MVVKELMRHERLSELAIPDQGDCWAVGRGYRAWEGVWMASGSVEKVDEWQEIAGSYDLD